jgi:hypothetical protein
MLPQMACALWCQARWHLSVGNLHLFLHSKRFGGRTRASQKRYLHLLVTGHPLNKGAVYCDSFAETWRTVMVFTRLSGVS